jgi:hypothetical protein
MNHERDGDRSKLGKGRRRGDHNAKLYAKAAPDDQILMKLAFFSITP